jgi:SnoaL-like protein
MLEEFSVQQVLSRYSEGASRADWDAVLSLYLPDAFWEIPLLGAKFEGHEHIRAGLVQFSSSMAYIVQINTPALITLEGAKATSRCLIRECGKYKDRDEGLEVLGAYDDRLLRTDQGWKFASRTCQVYGMHNFPLSRLGA